MGQRGNRFRVSGRDPALMNSFVACDVPIDILNRLSMKACVFIFYFF